MNQTSATRGRIVEDEAARDALDDRAPIFLEPDDGGQRLYLIRTPPFGQATPEHLARQGWHEFEPFVGQVVEVLGYRTASAIYNATIAGMD